MQATDNPTDMAINGAGFFQVLKPDGTTVYTRDGSFSVSAEGRLVTGDGYSLQPDINIPEGAQSLTIGKDGTVTIAIPGDAHPSTSDEPKPELHSRTPIPNAVSS